MVRGRPRKKVTTEEIFEPVGGELIEGKSEENVNSLGPGQPIIQTAEEAQVEQDLNHFMTSMGADGSKIRIYRLDMSGNRVFVSACSVDTVSEEYIQELFGAGKYDVRLFDAAGHYMAQRRIYISGSGAQEGKNAPVLQPTAVNGNGNGNGNIQLDMLRSELAASREVMLELVRSLSGGNQGGSTLSEFAAAMAALKETVKAPEGPSPFAMVTDLIGVLKQGIELGKTGLAGDGKEGWFGVIKDVVASIPAVAAAFKPGTASAPVAASIENNPGASMPLQLPIELKNQLKMGIEYLKSRARLNKDPSLWVDMIIDNLDDSYYVELAKLSTMSLDDFAAAIADPEILNPVYKTWFEQLMKGVKNALEEHGIEDGAGSNNPDVTDNVKPGPKLVS